jgi:hypothetical protein
MRFDIEKALKELRRDLERITRTITIMEGLSGRPPRSGAQRGRKSMGADERMEVSERMKRYWASQRAKRAVA